MKSSELKKYIEENIFEILNEASPEELKQKQLTITNRTADIAELNKQISLEKDPKKQAELKAKLAVLKAELAQAQAIKEAKDEDEEVEDTYGKEDEDDKKDAKIANTEPSKAELKKLDKEFSSTKLAKSLSPADKERLDKLESGIKKKLANPTKENIEIVRQLIKKPEIKKLFKDGGKDLKALISDVIR
jgi:hypothetical protein